MTHASRLRFPLFAALALGLAACNTATKMPNVSSANIKVQDQSTEAVALLNAFRASNGLGPVTVDPNLIQVAEFQAAAMAARDALTHEVAGDFTSRINAAGFNNSDAVENVGASHATAADAIASWIKSPYHHENMLLKNATRMGMARADSPDSRYGNYWCLDMTSDVAGAGPKMAAKQ
jgi:uncharacterized protein YkwD